MISAPVRVTVHSLEPQGWGLRVAKAEELQHVLCLVDIRHDRHLLAIVLQFIIARFTKMCKMVVSRADIW